MGILCDKQIRGHVPIVPFACGKKRHGIVSYGLSSYGYDVRIGTKFKVFSPPLCGAKQVVIDPKAFSEDFMRTVDTELDKVDHVLIPPNSFALGETLEVFTIPRDVLAVCVGKSTYARCGIIINVTPLEPEWCGRITMEISNTTPLPAKVYADEGIGFEWDESDWQVRSAAINRFNAQTLEKCKERSIGDVLNEFGTAQGRMLELVVRLPQRALTDPQVLFWLAVEVPRDPWTPIPLNSYEHYIDHTKWLRAWLDQEKRVKQVKIQQVNDGSTFRTFSLVSPSPEHFAFAPE